LPFSLDDHQQRDLAKVLGLKTLPPRVSGAIATAIANYKATEAGSSNTTIKNTLAALAELTRKGRAYEKAVARPADHRSALDDITLEALQPLARATLAGQSGARAALVRAAHARAEELRAHKRVNPRTESLRLFCGWLRVIFNGATDHLKGRVTIDEAWRQCRQFAMEVFAVAGINHADFDAHPERLTEYLGTDVTAR
jgi:multidrug efflux pump subunit AcrA (membrane-fusion protein)